MSHESKINELKLMMDTADLGYINSKSLRLMSVGAGEDPNVDPMYTYTYTGCLVGSFEMTVIGTTPQIAANLINTFYQSDFKLDSSNLEELPKAMRLFIDENGPSMKASDGKLEKVPFNVALVTGTYDAYKAAMRRKYLTPAFEACHEINNLTYPVVRVTFLK